jgi:hypothetical protein
MWRIIELRQFGQLRQLGEFGQLGQFGQFKQRFERSELGNHQNVDQYTIKPGGQTRDEATLELEGEDPSENKKENKDGRDNTSTSFEESCRNREAQRTYGITAKRNQVSNHREMQADKRG